MEPPQAAAAFHEGRPRTRRLRHGGCDPPRAPLPDRRFRHLSAPTRKSHNHPSAQDTLPPCATSVTALRVADVLEPVDRAAVELLLDGEVAHPSRRGGPMPVLLARFEPDQVTRADLFNTGTLALQPTKTRRDDQCLPERRSVPSGARTRLENDQCSRDPGRLGRAEQGIDADSASELLGQTLVGRLRAAALDLHDPTFRWRRTRLASQ